MKKIFSFLLLGLLLSIGNVWAAFEKASSIAVGDQVVFVYETGTMELTGISSTSTPYGVGIEYTTTPAGTWTFDVVAGSATNTFAFKNGDNYLAWSSGNSLKVSSTLNSNSSWTVTFENGNATISNAQTPARKLQWNTGNPRFACYTTSQKAIQLYKKVNASVAAPVFSPAEGSFFETQNVSITCPTNGAAIYYTLDGSDPTSESTPYSNPIEVSETKTIKAIAIVGNESSSIASATYTIVTQKTIAEVRAQETGSVFTQGIVTSSSSDGKTVYIQDASAGVVIYSTSDLSLTVGDEITVKGTLSSYHNLLEITSPVVSVLSQGNSVSPAVKTIAEINADNTYSLQGLLIKIENAKVSEINEQNVTLAQSANTIVVRFANASDVTTAGIAVDDVISLVGNIGCYNVAQIANPTDVQIAVNEEPSISVSATEINATAAETEGTITVTYNNITTVAADVYFCNATGTADATYDWITASINNNNNLEYLVEENTSTEVRNAYLKVWAYDDDFNEVYSELITVSQAGKVGPNFTWDLSTDNTLTATETEMSWGSNYATMIAAKANAQTPTNNYYPGANNRTSTRLYSGSTLTITPTSGYSIAKVVFEATTTNYASALSNSTWANASASVDETVVTITPTNGSIAVSATIGATCGFNSVQVFYNGPASASLTLGANGYSTYAAGFAYTVFGAEVYKAAYSAGSVVLTKVSGVIPAEQGIILKGEVGAPVTITPSAEEAITLDGNELVGTLVATAVSTLANPFVLATQIDGGEDVATTKFYPCGDGIVIPANKAYIELPANAPVRIIFAENNATAIQNLEGDENAVKFIENGKLYIRKNGVVYDATGAVVR